MTNQETADAESHNKPCTLCNTPRPVLVRCQIDETGKWHFVCPGKCWTSVSGGTVDAKGHEDEYPHYRYGGMWKNRHADGPLHAKKPKKGNKKLRKAGEVEDHIDGSGAQEEDVEEASVGIDKDIK